ncbi:MAG: SPOR domain-containing protein [Chitinophagales bacterium]|nr:SPOR domain-containing protein [Bacteroidota bacterium]MCB9255823.1 SPOR domain-containing protein [Chitinophagales bacterium]
MIIDFEKHILELLKNNQCVVLPGFGAFILKSVPSDIQTHVIYPPSKQIAFNRNVIHDDELLTGALMGTYGLEYSSAKNQVLSYASQLAYTLKKDKKHSLRQIGNFSLGEEGQVVFKASNSIVVDKESFGLQKIAAKAIAKEIISSSNNTKLNKKELQIQVAKEERKQISRKRSKLAIAGFVSSILLIISLFTLIFTDTHFLEGSVQKAGFVDLLFPNDSHVVSFENQKLSSFELINPVDQKEGLMRNRVLSIEEEGLAEGYYIVLGSYSSLQNAERYEETLFGQGLDSYVLSAESSFYRVCIFADENYLKAKAMLASNLASSQDLWLIKNLHN